MNLLSTAELTLEELDSLRESPVLDELAEAQETTSFKFTSGF